MSYTYFGTQGFRGLGAAVSVSDAAGAKGVDAAKKCISKKGSKAANKSQASECIKAGVSGAAAAVCGVYTGGLAAGVCGSVAAEVYDAVGKAISGLFGSDTEARRKALAGMKKATTAATAQVQAAQSSANDEWNAAGTAIGLFYIKLVGSGITSTEIFKLLTDNGGSPPPDILSWYLAPAAAFSPGAETSKMARPAIRTNDCNYQVPNPLKGLGAMFSWSASVTGGSTSGKNSSGQNVHSKCSPSTGGYCYVSAYNNCINDWPKFNNAWRQQRAKDALAQFDAYYDKISWAKTKAAAYIASHLTALKAQEKQEAAARAAQAASDAARAKALAKPKAPPRPTAIVGNTAAQKAAIEASKAAKVAAGKPMNIWGELLGRGTVGLLWKLGNKSA